jgi:hypothetical protein
VRISLGKNLPPPASRAFPEYFRKTCFFREKGLASDVMLSDVRLDKRRCGKLLVASSCLLVYFICVFYCEPRVWQTLYSRLFNIQAARLDINKLYRVAHEMSYH